MAAHNEPLVTHLYTADPSAHVFEGKLYIYPSHDIDHDGPTNDNGDQYAMEDYHVFSLENPTSPCVDHGVALHLRDVPWASKQMWAPDAAYRKGTYYLFSRPGIRRVFSVSEWLRQPLRLVLFRLKKAISKGASALIPPYSLMKMKAPTCISAAYGAGN